MTPSQQGDKRIIDDLRLAEDDATDAFAHLLQAFAKFFDFGYQIACGWGDGSKLWLGSAQCNLSRVTSSSPTYDRSSAR